MTKATLDFDFANNNLRTYERTGLEPKQLRRCLSSVRASTATYSSPTVIQAAAINAARITYAADGACAGLLCEEQRTNLLLHSQYTGASGETPPTGWVESGTDTGTTTTSPSPRFTGAVRIAATGTAQRENIAQIVTLAAATTYTLSAYFAAGTNADNNVMRVTTSDTPTGTLTLAASAVTGAGVYSITFTTVAGGNYAVYIGLGCTGNATGTVIHETPQLEAGPAATSYIPTTTAQVTRVADAISRALTTTNANAGSIFIEFDLTSFVKDGAASATIVKLNNSANSANRGFGLTLSQNTYSAYIRNPSSFISTSIAVADSLMPAKALISFDNATLKLMIAVNGSTNELTLGSPIDLTGLVSNLFISGGSAMAGALIEHSKTVKRCTYIPRALTAAEAQAITA